GADEDLSDGGSPRVIVYGYDGLPMQPVSPPSPDYVPGPEHPPSPDYVPGPEHPPSPVEVPYIPEPEYPEYLVPFDAEASLEDQSLPADASPTALSPGYVVDSDLEEDPEEDHTDYPIDGRDGDDEPSDDDDDDINNEYKEPFEDKDDNEEEHLASTEFDVLIEDGQFHYETARLLDQEALVSREAWPHSVGLSSTVSLLQGQLSAALGQIHALQTRDQTHVDDPKGAGSSA
ncbi:hypothetical protein Tco_0825713, partial [Tanacetum coccineum]